MRVQIDTHYLPGWTDLLGKIERRNAMPRSHVQNRCPWKKLKMLEQRFGKRRRPGIMFGERPGRHGSLSMSNYSPQTVQSEGALKTTGNAAPSRRASVKVLEGREMGALNCTSRRHGRTPVTESVPPTWAPEGAFAAFRGLGQ